MNRLGYMYVSGIAKCLRHCTLMGLNPGSSSDFHSLDLIPSWWTYGWVLWLRQYKQTTNKQNKKRERKTERKKHLSTAVDHMQSSEVPLLVLSNEIHPCWWNPWNTFRAGHSPKFHLPAGLVTLRFHLPPNKHKNQLSEHSRDFKVNFNFKHTQPFKLV